MHNRVSGEAVVFSWRLLNLLNYRLSYGNANNMEILCKKEVLYVAHCRG